MDKINFGASEVLMLSGTAIIISGQFIPGVIFCSLGVISAAIRYSLKYQLDREELEARQKIYEDIKEAAANGVQGVQTIIDEGAKFLH